MSEEETTMCPYTTRDITQGESINDSCVWQLYLHLSGCTYVDVYMYVSGCVVVSVSVFVC